MERQSQYIYDFNYSVTPDSPLLAQESISLQTNTPSHLPAALSQLARSPLIASRDAAHFCLAVASQQSFLQLASLLLELAEIELGLRGRKGRREREEAVREELCGALREAQGLMGKQKDHYTSLAILLLTLLLLRVLRLQHGIRPQPTMLFHFLHWELKGQHSTDLFFSSLAAETLVPGGLEQLVEGEWAVHSMQGSVAFKRPPSSMMNSFALALNKENHALNQHFKPNFKAMKKGMPNREQLSSRPLSFANCGFSNK